MNSRLSEYRQLLDGILDQLIPANPEKRIPAAGAFGVGEFMEARAAEDQSIMDALLQLLMNGAAREARSTESRVSSEMVAHIESNDAANFNVLLSLTYKGYYSRPEIRSLVGLESWPVHPKGYDVPVEPADMINKLTAPVKERGPMYRDSTDKKQVST